MEDIIREEIVADCNNEACVEEIDKLEAEIASYMCKNQSVKQQYNVALIENLKKDFVLYNLLHQNTEKSYEEFIGTFPVETIKRLQSIGQNQENDSSFILAAVRGLYSDNLTKLKNKSYSGPSKRNLKEGLTPEKVNHLKSIYEKRMEYMKPNSSMVAIEERKKKFSKHVKTAIQTINKAK